MFARTLVAVAITAVTQPALANVIVDWDLNGTPGNQDFTSANFAATGLTGLNLSRGPSLTASGAGNSFSASGWNVGEYFEFGFTVADGLSVDVQELFIGTRSSGTGPGSLGLFYSGDNFTGNLFDFNQAPGANFVNSAIDLTSLTGLTGSVIFRIVNLNNVAANGGSVGSGGTFRVTAYFENGLFNQNLGFTGDVHQLAAPVPVPAAVWLLGSALAGMAATRRDRQA